MLNLLRWLLNVHCASCFCGMPLGAGPWWCRGHRERAAAIDPGEAFRRGFEGETIARAERERLADMVVAHFVAFDTCGEHPTRQWLIDTLAPQLRAGGAK